MDLKKDREKKNGRKHRPNILSLNWLKNKNHNSLHLSFLSYQKQTQPTLKRNGSSKKQNAAHICIPARSRLVNVSELRPIN